MLIILRQPNIDVSADYKNALTLQDAAFIRAYSAEVFDYGLQFLPSKDQDQTHDLIKKVNDSDWMEPNTGIVYDFLYLAPDSWLSFVPVHLEIKIPPAGHFSRADL